MEKIMFDQIPELFESVGTLFVKKKEELCDMDAKLGDGDLGRAAAHLGGAFADLTDAPLHKGGQLVAVGTGGEEELGIVADDIIGVAAVERAHVQHRRRPGEAVVLCHMIKNAVVVIGDGHSVHSS